MQFIIKVLQNMDLGGRTLLAAAIQAWPVFEIVNKRGILEIGDAIESNVVKILMEKMNFK